MKKKHTDLKTTTMNIHDKIKQWKQLDYLETNNKELWRNLEYQIRRHKGKILLGLPRDVLDIKILEKLEQTLDEARDQ